VASVLSNFAVAMNQGIIGVRVLIARDCTAQVLRRRLELARVTGH
jgi:hypothetical protein